MTEAANIAVNSTNGTVTLSGTPTAAGAASFKVNVTDTAGGNLTEDYSLTVNPVLSIAPAALAVAVVGTATNQTITLSDETEPYTAVDVTDFLDGGTGLTAASLTTDEAAGP